MFTEPAHARNFSFLSANQFTFVLVNDARLPPRAKLLGLTIASLGGGEPVSASCETLMRMCSIAAQSVLIAERRRLERFGYLAVVRKGNRIVSYTPTLPTKGGAR